MRYVSTRDNTISLEASQAIIQGIAEDGGLFVPETFPKVSLSELKDLDYKDLAFAILSKFLTDFSEKDLKDCIEKAYDDKFDTKEIAPLVKVGDEYILELYHGPTLAFKDMALSILPHLLKKSLKINEVKQDVVILTATSGDTGKAALEGFADVDGTKIVVFFPEEGVSKVQKLQMKTQEGDNTCVVGIQGNFDDAQNGVKQLFNDINFAKELRDNNYILSSANSINIGRLIPQIVYYFHSYFTLVRDHQIEMGDQINFSVPTGNFGNILAGYYAKQMGLPINKLICASNENKVLTDFFETGMYDKRRELKLTSSPSMDILISSNLERLLYHLDDDNDGKAAQLMNELSQKGFYEIDSDKLVGFYGAFASEEDVIEIIHEVYDTHGYVMDPHTAVAYKVNKAYQKETADKTQPVVVSTASPYKFAPTVAEAIGIDTLDKNEFDIIDSLSERTGIEIPQSINELKSKNIIHDTVCEKDEMERGVRTFLNVGDQDD